MGKLRRGIRAEVLVDERLTDDLGAVLQETVFRVPRSPYFPEGVKYSLAYVPRGHTTPAVLYDNHRGKGHHRHIHGHESPYRFRDVGGLLEDFRRDVHRYKQRGTDEET